MAFACWWKRLWLRRKTASADRPRLVMYTRHGCHLCDEAWESLRTVRQKYDIDVRQLNIDANAELAERYGSCVPVISVNE